MKIIEKLDVSKNETHIKNDSSATDYSVYEMAVPEKIVYFIMGAGVLFCIAYVFYRSFLISAVVSIFAVLYPSIRRKQIIVKRKKTLNLQFKDALYSLSSAVGSGSSDRKSVV